LLNTDKNIIAQTNLLVNRLCFLNRFFINNRCWNTSGSGKMSRMLTLGRTKQACYRESIIKKGEKR